MLKFDYFFFTKYILRTILFNKIHTITNTYTIPFINKLKIFFSLSNIVDVDDVQIYNYLYLFKYFLGRRAFLTKRTSIFNLGNDLILLLFA